MEVKHPMSHRKVIGAWLLVGVLMIAGMIVLGGITRLTQSGLSIVEWKPITGILPPLSHEDWDEAFEAYRQFPQYAILNQDMTLEEFKTIFWWEYIHRLWGRLIGLVFIVPFLLFLRKGWLSRSQLVRLGLIFLAGALQGLVGWIMVQSGLNDLPHVSHLRLTLHFLMALFLFGLVLWEWLRTISGPSDDGSWQKQSSWVVTLGLLLLLQVTYGALTAGLKAGHMYNTFPTMNGSWIPAELWMLSPWIDNLFSNPVTVQFLHRFVGVALLLLVWVYRWRAPSTSALQLWLALLITAQLVLGVAALLWSVPVWLGVLHQAGAVCIVGFFVAHLYSERRKATI